GLADLRLARAHRGGRLPVHLDDEGGQLGGEVGGDVGGPVDRGNGVEHVRSGALHPLAVDTADDHLQAAGEAGHAGGDGEVAGAVETGQPGAQLVLGGGGVGVEVEGDGED